jgi:hypothetical protein
MRQNPLPKEEKYCPRMSLLPVGGREETLERGENNKKKDNKRFTQIYNIYRRRRTLNRRVSPPLREGPKVCHQ